MLLSYIHTNGTTCHINFMQYISLYKFWRIIKYFNYVHINLLYSSTVITTIVKSLLPIILHVR